MVSHVTLAMSHVTLQAEVAAVAGGGGIPQYDWLLAITGVYGKQRVHVRELTEHAVGLEAAGAELRAKGAVAGVVGGGGAGGVEGREGGRLRHVARMALVRHPPSVGRVFRNTCPGGGLHGDPQLGGLWEEAGGGVWA